MKRCGAIKIVPPTRVYLVCATRMRKGVQGLAMLVWQVLAENPFDDDVYAFRGRRAGTTASRVPC